MSYCSGSTSQIIVTMIYSRWLENWQCWSRSSCQTLDCACRWRDRTRRIVLWCGKLDRTPAEIDRLERSSLSRSLLPLRPTCSLRTRLRISASDAGSPAPLLASAEKQTELEESCLNFPSNLLASQLLSSVQSVVHKLLHISLQPSSKILQPLIEMLTLDYWNRPWTLSTLRTGRYFCRALACCQSDSSGPRCPRWRRWEQWNPD